MGQVVFLSFKSLDVNPDSASWEYDFEMLTSTSLNAFFVCKMEISGLPISADGYENQMRECVWTHKHLLVANNHILPMECYFLNPVSF